MKKLCTGNKGRFAGVWWVTSAYLVCAQIHPFRGTVEAGEANSSCISYYAGQEALKNLNFFLTRAMLSEILFGKHDSGTQAKYPGSMG